MNIGQLKEYIKDLPDDMEIGIFNHDNQWDEPAEEFEISEYLWYKNKGDIKGKYLIIK